MIEKRLNKTGDTAIEKQQQKYSTSLEKRHPMAFVVQILALRSPETVPLKKNYVGSSSFLACFLITGLNLPVKFLRAAWRGGEEGGGHRAAFLSRLITCYANLFQLLAPIFWRGKFKNFQIPPTHTLTFARGCQISSRRDGKGEKDVQYTE